MCCCDESEPTKQEFSRREVIISVLATGASVALSGCGGGSLFDSTNGGLTRRVQTLTLNFDTNPVTVEDGRSINYLAAYSGDGLQSAYWGTQQPNGIADEILQALVWDMDADQGVRVKFDGRGLPSEVINEANGAFVTCFWEADRSVFKFYQPSGAYIGGCSVTGSAPNFTLEQLADSVIAGLFIGTLEGATDGIFSITIGGTERAASQSERSKKGFRNTSKSTVKRATEPFIPALTGLSQVTGAGDYPPAAKTLLQALSAEYLSTGQSNLFAQITQTALKDTGLRGLHLDDGLAILRGLLSAPVLQKATTDMLAKINSGEDLVKQKTIRYEASSPGLTGYLAANVLPAPLPTSDGTAISGVMVSRDFNSIPVNGVIDASGRFSASGSANGVIVTMTGTVQGSTASGQWTSSASTRVPGGGGFNGNQQPIGQCQTQQNSGGQGVFTNTYDLKDCGKFSFSYQAYTIPDHLRVLNGNQTIFDTGGPVSGGTTVDLYVSGSSTLVTVVVLASLEGTAWDYTVGCPS